jgi:hypothetical protein
MNKSQISKNNDFFNENTTFSKAIDPDEQQIINRETTQANGV